MEVGLAAPFRLNDPLEDSITEYNIRFDSNRNSLSNLIEFAEKYNDRRINLEFVNGVDFEVLRVVTKVNSDIAVRLVDSDYLECGKIKEAGFKFFIDQYSFPVYNYSILDSILTLGVSDIYIYDDLWYNLQKVSKRCSQENVKIRVVLNKIPGTSFNRGSDVRSPIFRPQDFNLLSKYIDVIEFECWNKDKRYNWSMFEVLYETWFEKHKWVGDLREINLDLTLAFPNESVLPDLTDYKIKCSRNCSKGGCCRRCGEWLEIGQMLDSKEIAFRLQDE